MVVGGGWGGEEGTILQDVAVQLQCINRAKKKKGHLFSLHGAETSVCISPTCRIAEVLFMVRAGGCFVREVGVQ